MNNLPSSRQILLKELQGSIEGIELPFILKIDSLPGMGKSTLLKYLGIALNNECVEITRNSMRFLEELNTEQIIFVDDDIYQKWTEAEIKKSREFIIIVMANILIENKNLEPSETLILQPLSPEETEEFSESDDLTPLLQKYSLGIPLLIERMINRFPLLKNKEESFIEQDFIQILGSYLFIDVRLNNSYSRDTSFEENVSKIEEMMQIIIPKEVIDYVKKQSISSYEIITVNESIRLSSQYTLKDINTFKKYENMAQEVDGAESTRLSTGRFCLPNFEISIYVPNIDIKILEEFGILCGDGHHEISIKPGTFSKNRDSLFRKYKFLSNFAGHNLDKTVDCDSKLSFINDSISKTDLPKEGNNTFYFRIPSNHQVSYGVILLGYTLEHMLQHYGVKYFASEPRNRNTYKMFDPETNEVGKEIKLGEEFHYNLML